MKVQELKMISHDNSHLKKSKRDTVQKKRSDPERIVVERKTRSNFMPKIDPELLNLTSSSSSTSKSSRSTSSLYSSPSCKLCLLDNPTSDPTPILGRRRVAAAKKKARAATKGPLWFGMKAPEMTEERKNDLAAMKLRGALDTKSFYKRNSSLATHPKHFQIGKIVETKADFYNSRLTKKQRKATIAEEFMAELNG
ncbi:deoxynucleotidyltransferase terminal-interacting protein 2 [Folsomia candida]|uniref:Deoxynucleotidyltransferase terminal-interacting protein 2 n=1 Tax=Folsomia candida TaxID=158441 RepID=A0A226CUZ3_FOLCA|nr:deoxynucleotidyltransferase terminal-interacting protein 2 [Folsomia candida]OXA37225.1 Deoxynucleotidyltransferase terminal-interacting protein 2 [Folsomia candida]